MSNDQTLSPASGLKQNPLNDDNNNKGITAGKVTDVHKAPQRCACSHMF